jgi:NitT/TauT family transport system substrate-binding protein
MLDRRSFLRAGAATFGVLASTPASWAQSAPRVKIRYNEVVHSILYAPAYVAMAKGFFEERGLDITMTTAQGGDKSIAALLSGAADIALIGPETAIYVHNSESPTKVHIFSGLTATDGYILVGREKLDRFDWAMLRGKEVMGWRPGSTPLLYLEAAMRLSGIDPHADVKLTNNIAVPARMGAWLAGDIPFAIFAEPDASQLELDGKAHILASIGQTVGFVDYTAFMATDAYIHENPAVIQNWTNAIYKAQKWTETAPTAEIARVLMPFFAGVSEQAMTSGVEHYSRLKVWKSSPIIAPAAIDKFQDILVQGGVLDSAKRVKYSDVVVTEFAAKAE